MKTKKILIVEDEQALREVFATLLKLQDFEVYEAANGREALEQLENIKPDLIILDILMPVMGGIEFLEKAKLPERFPDTRVLVLSNLSQVKSYEKVVKLQNTRYILKSSVSPGELLTAVKDLLKT